MFWKRHKAADEPPKGNPYGRLRRQILELPASIVGFDPPPEGRSVYGGIMDWPVAGAVATVVALEDGTASLYLSTGGGIVGGGAHPAVRQAARTFLLGFEQFLGGMVDDPEGDLPPEGLTDLRALTIAGRRSVRIPTQELAGFRHPMANVFHAGQSLLGALRQVSEGQGSPASPPP